MLLSGASPKPWVFRCLVPGTSPKPWFFLGFAPWVSPKPWFFKVLRLGLRQNLGFSMFLDIKTRKGAFKDKKKRWVWGPIFLHWGQLVPAGFELGLRCSNSSPLDRSWPLGGALASMSSQQTPSPPAVRVFAFHSMVCKEPCKSTLTHRQL